MGLFFCSKSIEITEYIRLIYKISLCFWRQVNSNQAMLSRDDMDVVVGWGYTKYLLAQPKILLTFDPSKVSPAEGLCLKLNFQIYIEQFKLNSIILNMNKMIPIEKK